MLNFRSIKYVTLLERMDTHIVLSLLQVLNTNLKYLSLCKINNIIEIFNCQTPKGNFRKLKELEVGDCNNLRNILVPPMFRGLTSLTKLKLSKCKELKEVIAQDQEAQEGQKNVEETLFPLLKELELSDLPKMRRFCHMINALELPSLEEMEIVNCPMLESLSMGFNDSGTKFLFNSKVCISIFKFFKLYYVKHLFSNHLARTVRRNKEKKRAKSYIL
jgi:hypothetical protein